MIVAITGVSGSMGYEAFVQSIGLEFIERIKVLLTPRRKNDKLARRLKKTYGDRVEVLRGWLNDLSVCEQLVSGCDMVINMAAVIPPKSDKDGQASYLCNQIGAMRLTDAVCSAQPQPYISPPWQFTATARSPIPGAEWATRFCLPRTIITLCTS